MSRSTALVVALLLATGAAPAVTADGPVRIDTESRFVLPSRNTDPAPFTSNGCSGFREGKFFGCCFVHDFAFWRGGTKADRRGADRDLRQCLIDVTHGNLYDRVVADIGWLLMAMERIPGRIINDGWGRGWQETKRAKYDPLTPAQASAVDAERRRVCSGMNLNAASGGYRVSETQEIGAIPARRFCGEMLPNGSR